MEMTVFLCCIVPIPYVIFKLDYYPMFEQKHYFNNFYAIQMEVVFVEKLNFNFYVVIISYVTK